MENWIKDKIDGISFVATVGAVEGAQKGTARGPMRLYLRTFSLPVVSTRIFILQQKKKTFLIIKIKSLFLMNTGRKQNGLFLKVILQLHWLNQLWFKLILNKYCIITTYYLGRRMDSSGLQRAEWRYKVIFGILLIS